MTKNAHQFSDEENRIINEKISELTRYFEKTGRVVFFAIYSRVASDPHDTPCTKVFHTRCKVDDLVSASSTICHHIGSNLADLAIRKK